MDYYEISKNYSASHDSYELYRITKSSSGFLRKYKEFLRLNMDFYELANNDVAFQ